jgi:hydrogenase nickel incorporation protein HypA/HybF
MHEGAIVRSLFDIAVEIKKEENLKEVSKIKVIAGKFHQIVDEVMRMHFDLMKMEIPGFEEAVLEMEEKEVVIHCRNCGKKQVLEEPIFFCPACGSGNTEMISGKELHIASIEGLKE